MAPEDHGTAPRSVQEELHGYYLEDLRPGMTAAYSKTVSDVDVVLFAGVSGDTNPLHLSEEFAAASVFEGRIAHGMLTASLISTLIGTKLPGPGCIYMGQTLKFTAPVRIGDTVLTRATINDIDHDKARVTLDTTCTVGDEVVIEGSALVKVPMRHPPEA